MPPEGEGGGQALNQRAAVNAARRDNDPKGGSHGMRYVCSICGYVYDEAKQGKPFAALPETWTCPLCGAAKSAFAPEAAAKSAAPAPTVAPPALVHGDMQKLSPGALSILCSNLARGCEKQYKEEEAALFREIADWFAAAAPAAEETGVDALAASMGKDLSDGYPALSAAAAQAGDRGTQRICVWGEKVTAILKTLLERYRREGEAMLRDTDIWVCSVCGFAYVGKEPPRLCPVCKVPAWKFEKIEGRASA